MRVRAGLAPAADTDPHPGHTPRKEDDHGHCAGPQSVRQSGEPGGPDLSRHRASRDPRHQRVHRPARGLLGRAPDRRPAPGAADRHPEADRLRVRQGDRRRPDRGLRPRARPALRQRHRAGRGLPDRDRRVRVGTGQRRRARAQPHLGPQGPGDPDHDPDHRRQGRRRDRDPGVGVQGPGRAEVHRVGVPRLPGRRVHDADPHHRPGDGHLAGRPLALHRHRRRLGRVLRRDQADHARAVRRGAEPGPAADAVRDGPGRPRGVRRGGRDQVLGAEQAPLRLRPLPVRPGEPQRGLPRRRPAVRADPGHACMRDDAPPAGRAWDTIPGFC